VLRDKVRRGVAFGGFALVFSIFVIPLARNVVAKGPLDGFGLAVVWLLIAAITAFGFYLGYSGWGRHKEL
jgi:hypothetical protein